MAVMTVIVESDAGVNLGTRIGPFQQGPGWPCTGDAYKDAIGNGKLGVTQGGFYGMAIPFYKAHVGGNLTLGMMAQRVQVADPNINPVNSDYAQKADKVRNEAQHAVKVFGGINVASSGQLDQVSYKKKFEFMVGEPDGPHNENYLAAIYRLADDVNWSAFWVRDVLHYQSEEELFKAKARARLRRYEDGVESISFEWDRGKRLNQMIVQVRMARWVCPVGTVVIFDEGGPAQGRWLVTNIRRSMFDELGEIVLKKPMRKKLEPANQPGSRDPSLRTDDTSVQDWGGIVGGCGVEDVHLDWTPKEIIDKCVIPIARAHNMMTGINPDAVVKANAIHGPTSTGNRSDHQGPPDFAWADDMSNGTQPTPQMDDLASELIMAFNLPDLAEPLATSGDHPGNWVQATYKGFRFQLGYRTTDHYNHVHFGVKRVAQPPRRGPLPGP